MRKKKVMAHVNGQAKLVRQLEGLCLSVLSSPFIFSVSPRECVTDPVTREGITDPEILESLACVEALCLAKDLYATRVHISSDCANVVNEIKGELMRGPNHMILKEFLERKADFQEVTVGHERRESNGEAHRQTRLATSSDYGRHVWFIDSPTGVNIHVNSLLANQ